MILSCIKAMRPKQWAKNAFVAVIVFLSDLMIRI